MLPETEVLKVNVTHHDSLHFVDPYGLLFIFKAWYYYHNSWWFDLLKENFEGHLVLGVLNHSMLNAKFAQNGIGWKLGDPKFTDWASLSLLIIWRPHLVGMPQPRILFLIYHRNMVCFIPILDG